MNLSNLRYVNFLTSATFICLFCFAMTNIRAFASPNLIVDGDFEQGGGGIPATFSNGQFLEQGKNWAVFASPNMGADVVPNNFHPDIFFITTSGSNYLFISADPHASDHFPNSSVAQEIGTELTAGKTYRITFRQCGKKSPSVRGSVNVEVVPTDGGGKYIYDHTFDVSGDWHTKNDKFTVPANATGKYTLVFTANNQARVAIVDNVSLSEQ